jgi:hypothetical protein
LEALCDRRQELLLALIELKVLDDQNLRTLEPHRSVQGGRSRSEYRTRIGDLALALRLERAVETSEGAQAFAIFSRVPRTLRERLEVLGWDGGLPQVLERPRERSCDGSPWHVAGEAKAADHVLVEQLRG